METNDYVDLVLIKHDRSPSIFLFEAPVFSGLKKGDVVLCDTAAGDSIGKIILDAATLRPQEPAYQMLVCACSATKPLKRIIRRYISYRDFEYPGEKEEAETV